MVSPFEANVYTNTATWSLWVRFQILYVHTACEIS